MARITVEDCIKNIGAETKFGLCVIATARAKEILSGALAVVTVKANYPAALVALKEIAYGKLDIQSIKGKISDSLLDSQSLIELENNSLVDNSAYKSLKAVKETVKETV